MLRLRLLLSLPKRGNPGDVRDVLAAAVAAAPADGPAFGWGHRTADDPIAGTAHRADLGPDLSAFEAYLEVKSSALDDAIVAVEAVLNALGPRVDLARSAVIVGDHGLTPLK